LLIYFFIKSNLLILEEDEEVTELLSAFLLTGLFFAGRYGRRSNLNIGERFKPVLNSSQETNQSCLKNLPEGLLVRLPNLRVSFNLRKSGTFQKGQVSGS